MTDQPDAAPAAEAVDPAQAWETGPRWSLSPSRASDFMTCPLLYRFRVVGLTAGSSFDLPVTQSELADVMGLSTVHTNRAVKHLRATGLVGWVGSRVTIHDLGSLAAMSDFDPLYLNLRKEHR